MPTLNQHYLKLKAGYLFPEIDRRVRDFAQSNAEAASRIIRCGIGDVTEPLPQAARDAMHRAIDDLGRRETFRGYGPPFGHDFIREAIAKNDFADRGLDISIDEIFLSDGSKVDCGAILDIFATGPGVNRLGITDPVYPVYVDSNVMAGNTGPALGSTALRAVSSPGSGSRAAGGYEGVTYLPCTKENDFVPEIPSERLDLIYLCYPNNPTGGMITRDRLEAWVRYALENDAIILYDVAYEAFIREEGLPRSIYEIDGARRCAIEFHSFSKNGGFTGVRCGYTVCPKDVQATTHDGQKMPLHGLWARRWSTKSNGVSYITQRGAEALYSDDGKRQVRELTDFYMGNAAILRKGCEAMGLETYGGVNAPYVWVACPEGIDSWGMFDRMLEHAHTVITPGAGFGRFGEGYFRISAFNSRQNVEEVVRRMKSLAAHV